MKYYQRNFFSFYCHAGHITREREKLCPRVSSGRLNPFSQFPILNPIISTLTHRLKCHLYVSCFAVINSPTCPNESSCIVIKNTKLSLGFHCCISIQSFFFLFFYHNDLVDRWEREEHGGNDCDKNSLNTNNNFTSLPSICCRNVQRNQRKMFTSVLSIGVTYLFHIYFRPSPSVYPTPTCTFVPTRIYYNEHDFEFRGNR